MRLVPSAVTLERFPAALLRELVEGMLERPAEWHEEYPAAGLRGIARMLLGAYEAMGVPADDASPWWVSGIVVDGQVVGDAGFHGPPAGEPPVEVEIGYQVVPALRGRGLATRACALLLEHAWARGADVVRADVEPDNPHGPASHAVLRANGFRPTPQGDLAVAAPTPSRTGDVSPRT